jgi:peptidoglycan L-alanyl-D-glutamate endopeptidase CwlK
MKDSVSVARLAKLHPLVRNTFKSFIEECEALSPDTTLRITQGLRTFPEQQALYDQGRGKPGKIVTNARAGQSYHNYGLAIDLVELDGEKNEIADWKFDMGTLQDIAKKYGIVWGGNFKSIKDKPHFEKTFGFSWQQLLELHNKGGVDADGYVLIAAL